MDSTVQEWNVDYVGFGGLEDWLNEAKRRRVGVTYFRAIWQELGREITGFLWLCMNPQNAKLRAAQKLGIRRWARLGGHANEGDKDPVMVDLERYLDTLE
jgi:hypothetical protein